MFLCWKRIYFNQKIETGDFPGGPVVKNLPSNAEDAGSIPGWRTNSTCCGAAEQVRHNWTEACVQRQGSFMPQPRLNEAKQIRK